MVHQGGTASPFITVKIDGVSVSCLLDSACSANMLSHISASNCRLHTFPKADIFHTTDSGEPLVLQGFRNVPTEISDTGLPPIFTTVYEVIPNGIHDDAVDTLTIELFTDADYVVTVTDTQVLLFEYVGLGRQIRSNLML